MTISFIKEVSCLEMLKQCLGIDLVVLLFFQICITSASDKQNGQLQIISNHPLLLGNGNDGYSAVPPLASIQLTCTPVGRPLPSDTILQWWEEALIVNDPRRHREVFPTKGGCGLTLILHNVSLSDYGRYTCKTVPRPLISQEGIQFVPVWPLERNLEDYNIPERSVTILPSYDPSVLTTWAPVVSSRQYQRRLKVSLHCHPQHSVNHSALWTMVTDKNVRMLPHGNSLLVTTSRTLTKYLCHNATTSEVYSIHYLVLSEGRRVQSRAKIVYPPSDMNIVQIPYTSDIKRSGVVNLCLIQPYLSDLTSSYATFRDIQTNRTVTTSTANVVLSRKETGMTVTLGAQRVQEGLVYFVKVTNNRRDEFRTMAALSASVGEGIFTCSVNKRNEVSFRLNLTVLDTSHKHYNDSCFHQETEGGLLEQRPNVPRPVRPPKPPKFDFTSQPPPAKLSKGTSQDTGTSDNDEGKYTTSPLASASAYEGTITTSLLSVGGGVLLAVILLNAICIIKWCRKKHVQKVSAYNFWTSGKASLQHSFTNSLIIADELPEILQELQTKGLVYPFSLLSLSDELGTGAFGVVKRARLIDPATFTITTVAVKMLKDSATTEDEKDLLIELRTLSHIGRHPNVLSFVGATIDQGKIGLIVEYCEGGSLLDLLRAKRHDFEDPLSLFSVVEMASQVANGMIYLSSKKYIHRDLAARNVLVTGQYILKVADFGLAREVYHSVYRPTAKRLPIKWMAPEAILDGVYTSKSDVWSFGVLLWEMLTLGRAPYPGLPAHRVIKAIQSGYRMTQPRACPKELYYVMLCCWKTESLLRPDFMELKALLDSMSIEQNYYNLRECDCTDSDHTDSDSTSDGQECCKNKDYVNIMPMDWFSSNDPLAEFLQGSVCSKCVAPSDCAEELSLTNSLDSLCSVCRQI